MEDIGAAELKEFGAKDVNQVYRGVYFKTDLHHLYRINYQSKFISRILAPLFTFDCHSTRYLYNTASKIKWEKILSEKKTFAIKANVVHSKIKHSQYALQILKDAIVDYFNKKTGDRPDIDTDSPDLYLNLFISKNRATISLDTSGESLHKRGYRVAKGPAPIQETLAAAIIRLSKWKGEKPLFDPFCGSGTLLNEALLKYCRIPAGFKRERFGFEHLPDFDENKWLQIKENSEKNMRELPIGLLNGSDVNSQVLKDAKRNASNLPYGNRINFEQSDFRDLPPIKDATIVCNPPYGIRMGTTEDIAQMYKEFGDFLKQKCEGTTAYIYVGDRKLIPTIGLRPSFKRPLKNGDLDGRLLKIKVY